MTRVSGSCQVLCVHLFSLFALSVSHPVYDCCQGRSRDIFRCTSGWSADIYLTVLVLSLLLPLSASSSFGSLAAHPKPWFVAFSALLLSHRRPVFFAANTNSLRSESAHIALPFSGLYSRVLLAFRKRPLTSHYGVTGNHRSPTTLPDESCDPAFLQQTPAAVSSRRSKHSKLPNMSLSCLMNYRSFPC